MFGCFGAAAVDGVSEGRGMECAWRFNVVAKDGRILVVVLDSIVGDARLIGRVEMDLAKGFVCDDVVGLLTCENAARRLAEAVFDAIFDAYDDI